jgi:hypothetical protein
MNAASGASFLFESLGNRRISRELRPENLYRDPLAHQDMLGFVNDAHAAGSEAAFDAIFSQKLGIETILLCSCIFQRTEYLARLPGRPGDAES